MGDGEVTRNCEWCGKVIRMRAFYPYCCQNCEKEADADEAKSE